jgi:hypothetical protein
LLPTSFSLTGSYYRDKVVGDNMRFRRFN